MTTADQTAIQIRDMSAGTEDLESELRERSDAMERHRQRFDAVRTELKRRRETRDEQPPPETAEQASERARNYEQKLGENLALKVTMMEAEQAKLVVELEIAKEAQRIAEERLALIVKHLDSDETRTRAVAETARAHDRGELAAALGEDNKAWSDLIDHVRALVKREPMARDVAHELATRHAVGVDKPDKLESWIIDAIVEASK